MAMETAEITPIEQLNVVEAEREIIDRQVCHSISEVARIRLGDSMPKLADAKDLLAHEELLQTTGVEHYASLTPFDLHAAFIATRQKRDDTRFATSDFERRQHQEAGIRLTVLAGAVAVRGQSDPQAFKGFSFASEQSPSSTQEPTVERRSADGKVVKTWNVPVSGSGYKKFD